MIPYRDDSDGVPSWAKSEFIACAGATLIQRHVRRFLNDRKERRAALLIQEWWANTYVLTVA